MNLTRVSWRKSSHSGNSGNCIEIAASAAVMDESGRAVAVRDSKDPHGPKLAFTPQAWKAFTIRTKSAGAARPKQMRPHHSAA